MGLDWRRFIVAADEKDRMIGCGQLKPHGTAIVELASLAVRVEYQGRGVGRAIIEHLLAQAPRPLYLMCRPELGALYEKFGFQHLNIRDMPAYFRRLAKLVQLYSQVARTEDAVLVMKLQ
jgi:N-acetylglutamate synthase-like GNAT family acetyltransferase